MSIKSISLPILLAAAITSGCAAVDRVQRTDFRPVGSDEFNYRAQADAAQPDTSDASEQYRMELLELWLDDNGLCTDGYEITSREVVVRHQGLLGNVADIYYEGKCK